MKMTLILNPLNLKVKDKQKPCNKPYYYLTDDAERGTFDSDEVDEIIEESQGVKK